MKIVGDQNIPDLAAAFADLGEVELIPGRDIRRRHLADCQCLILRTVTRVDAALLRDTPVEFVASATIGTDHIDLDYLRSAGIGCSNAAGCNAEAAAEYVISGLYELSRRNRFDPLHRRAGIVGFGNVGTRLYHKLVTLGIDCLVCDPPLAAAGRDQQQFVDLERILRECDLISLHVPLTDGGAHPTRHLLDAERLRSLRQHCLLINAARGEVVDNAALLSLLHERDDLRVFLDTWENEPRVSCQLLRRVDLATPHIAGYSVEGRLRGTQMVLDAACRHFGTSSAWHMSQQLPAPRKLNPAPAANRLEWWQNLFHAHCDIRRDHDAFVSAARLDQHNLAKRFDALRRIYPDRLEYERWIVDAGNSDAPLVQLQALGFGVEN